MPGFLELELLVTQARGFARGNWQYLGNSMLTLDGPEDPPEERGACTSLPLASQNTV